MSLFSQKISSGTFCTTVELNPPASHDPQEAIEMIKNLPSEIDAVDITNCAFSNVRINPFALGKIIKDECRLDVIANFTCRNRNIIAAKSDLLGGLTLGITDVLCMAGDDPSSGEHPEASNVSDLNTCKLISIATELKAGQDTYTVGATACVDTGPNNIERLIAKRDAGADFFITQPVYTLDNVNEAAYLQDKIGCPFIVGFLPFKNLTQAKRLSKIPGFNIPGELIDRLENYPEPDFGQLSIEILFPLIQKASEYLSGIHLMPVGENWKIEPLISAAVSKTTTSYLQLIS